MDDLNLLRKVDLFSDFNDEELIKILQAMQKETYKKKEVIFWEDDPSEKLYLVRSGTIVISKKLEGYVEVVVARFGQGDLFGEMGLIDDIPRSANAQAEEKSELLVMNKESFQRLLQEDPLIASKLLMALLKMFSARLRDTNERLKDAVVWGMDQTAFDSLC